MVSSGEVNTRAESLPGKDRRVDDPRIYLAAERTFLAWVRTSLALMGFGFLIARFGLLIRETEVAVAIPEHAHRPTISPWLGFTMICFGVVVCLVSALRYRAYIQALEAGMANPSVSTRTPLVMAAILVLVGLVMAAHILAL
jgi:putative membrane protein